MIFIMFHAHAVFALQLLALAAGALVYAKGKSKNIKLVTAVGIIVMALAALGLCCTLYYGYMFWSTASLMMQNGKLMMAHTAMMGKS